MKPVAPRGSRVTIGVAPHCGEHVFERQRVGGAHCYLVTINKLRFFIARVSFAGKIQQYFYSLDRASRAKRGSSSQRYSVQCDMAWRMQGGLYEQNRRLETLLTRSEYGKSVSIDTLCRQWWPGPGSLVDGDQAGAHWLAMSRVNVKHRTHRRDTSSGPSTTVRAVLSATFSLLLADVGCRTPRGRGGAKPLSTPTPAPMCARYASCISQMGPTRWMRPCSGCMGDIPTAFAAQKAIRTPYLSSCFKSPTFLLSSCCRFQSFFCR